MTDAGRSYLAACRRILDDVGEAERAAAGEYRAPRGELSITAPIVFGRLHVLPVVMSFMASHPAVTVRLALSDRLVNILEDQVDLAIRVGALPDSSLVAVRVGKIRRVVCASPSYLAARGAPAAPEDLAHHDCVTFEGLSAADAWRFGVGKAAATFPVRSRLVVGTAEAAIDAAIAGMGVARVLNYQIADAARAGALVTVLEAHEPEPWPISLVHAGGRLLPGKLRAFLDHATPLLHARLAAPQ